MTEKTPRIAIVIGTRAEATKLAPLAHELQNRSSRFQTTVIATGQHRELLDGAIQSLQLKPAMSLGVLKDRPSRSGQATRLLVALETAYREVHPDWVVVQGDTTSTFIGALAAFHEGIKVAHVEAGLRSGDLSKPFPEEANRRLVSQIATLHFAPTPRARQNLIAEGTPPKRIHITGNTAVDALLTIHEYIEGHPEKVAPELDFVNHAARRIVTMTCHRRESFGEPMARMFKSVRQLADEFTDIQIIYPVHPNPNVTAAARNYLSNHERITLIPPLDYASFVWLMARSCLLLSDSGAVQEEAPSLRVPVLILRDVTERPECVESGAARLVGTDGQTLYRIARNLLMNESERQSMRVAENPFGDGCASRHIADILEKQGC